MNGKLLTIRLMVHSLGTLLAVLFLCSLGCSTHTKRLQAPRQNFFSNDLPAAQTSLEKLSKKRQDHTVAELDLAIVDLFQGNSDSAEQRLRKVRDQWDEYDKKSLAEESQALLTDDTARQYAGELYEKLLIGVFLSLSSLMRDGVDAEAYTLQTISKQQEFLERFNADSQQPLPDQFGIPPVVPYLRGILREATFHDQDDALRMYQLTAAMLPDHPQLPQDIARAQSGNHSQPGHGVVYVIALVGRGPLKVEQSAPVTQLMLFEADRIVSVLGQYSVPPTLAPIKVSAIACSPKQFDLMGVRIDSVPTTTTLPMTDLERLASETHQAQLPRIMARTVARRIVKKGAVYAAKHQLSANPISSLALDAAGVAWEATETADTRCWGLLPREIQIARLELPTGRHQITLEPVRAGQAVGRQTNCWVDVQDARNSFVMGYWPDMQPIGQLLVNTP